MINGCYRKRLFYVCTTEYRGQPSVFLSAMGITSLLLSLIILKLLLTLFPLLILVIRPTPQLFARNHFEWLPDSPFLSYNLVSLQRPTSSLRDIGLTVSQYTRGLRQVECVFCLCDIDEGEGIRELACQHHFYRSCLDRWLEFGRGTCPLCRDYLLPLEAKAKLAEMDDGDTDESAIALVAAFVLNRWWRW